MRGLNRGVSDTSRPTEQKMVMEDFSRFKNGNLGRALIEIRSNGVWASDSLERIARIDITEYGDCVF